MRVKNEDGFGETRESVLLRAVVFYDGLNELAEEGIIKGFHSHNDSICHIITALAIREANRADEYLGKEIVDGLEDEPITVNELKAILSRPLGEFLSFEV